MSAQYDAVGEEYAAVKGLPIATYAEQPSVRRMLGDVRGLRVIDLACGTGFYTRLVKRLGARAVVGVDISRAMIDAAEAQEASAPAGITYHQLDVTELGSLGEFDVALGVFLLNYATRPEDLLRMARAIRSNLARHGCLVAVTVHPDCAFGPTNYSKYGFAVTRVEPVDGGGHRIKLRAEIGAGFEVDNWRWSRAVYEDTLGQAGFREIVWEPILPTEEGRQAYPDGFWDDYLNDPILVGLRAVG